MRIVGVITSLTGLLIVLIIGYSAFINPILHIAGGAGKLKGYEYPVTKYELEKAVDSVLKKNTNIKRIL